MPHSNAGSGGLPTCVHGNMIGEISTSKEWRTGIGLLNIFILPRGCDRIGGDTKKNGV